MATATIILSYIVIFAVTFIIFRLFEYPPLINDNNDPINKNKRHSSLLF